MLLKDLKNANLKALFSSAKFKSLGNDLFGLHGQFMRPKEELNNCNKLFNRKELEFINIHESIKYSTPIKSINNISFQDFIDNNY